MAKKLSDEAKQHVINANLGLIPEKSKDVFNSKSLDGQYVLISNYIRKANEKNTIHGKLKSYLKSNAANPQEVKEMIKLCNRWIEKNKAKLISNLDEQIKKLQDEKEKYNNL